VGRQKEEKKKVMFTYIRYVCIQNGLSLHTSGQKHSAWVECFTAILLTT